jgi:hypothetical protein
VKSSERISGIGGWLQLLHAIFAGDKSSLLNNMNVNYSHICEFSEKVDLDVDLHKKGEYMKCANSKNFRVKNLNECLAELQTIHNEIAKIGPQSGSNRKEMQESIAQQVSVLRLLQSESRISSALTIGALSFAGSILGNVFFLAVKMIF